MNSDAEMNDGQALAAAPTEGGTNVRVDLQRIATGIDVGEPTIMLTAVRQTVVKRRRRRNAVIGVAAAGTLAMSGVVIANVIGSDSPATLTTSTEPGRDEDEVTVETTSDVAPPATLPPVPVQPSIGELVSDPAYALDASSYAGGAQLLEWNGGFLAIRSVFAPQALPAELPQEVIDKFPQEVLDVFGGELPATIDEATQMLEEAGLLDEVNEILESNPEVSEAIYAESPFGTVAARFSPDGKEWSDIETAFPAGADPWSMVSTGARVVAMSQPSLDRTGRLEASVIEVHSSSDLVNWTTQTIPAPAGPADLPEYVDLEFYANSLAANSDRWVLSVQSYQTVDPLELIDPVIREEIESSGSGYGIGADEAGLTISVGDELDGEYVVESRYEVGPAEPGVEPVASAPDAEPVTYTFTWAELGLDGLEEFQGFQNGESPSAVWTSNGVDEPIAVTPGSEMIGRNGSIVSVDSGFVAPVESGVGYSQDGVTWTTVELPGGALPGSLVPVGDSVLTFVQSFDGPGAGSTEPFRLDVSTLTWTPVEVPGLPEGAWLSAAGDGVATVIVDAAGASLAVDLVTTRMSVEVDGYRFESEFAFEAGAESISYVVTEVATGRIVSSESATDVDSDDPFEFAKESEDDSGIVLLDPESGDELFVAEFDDILFEYFDADGDVVDVEVGEESVRSPDEWILATDGVTWLVEQIEREESPVGDDEGFIGVNDIALVDGIVLVSQSDGSFIRYELG